MGGVWVTQLTCEHMGFELEKIHYETTHRDLISTSTEIPTSSYKHIDLWIEIISEPKLMTLA